MGNQLSANHLEARPFFLAPLLVGAVTPALIALDPILPANMVWFCYLMPVILMSVRWGFAGAATTVVVAAVAGDFFFTQPYYSLWMEDSRDVAALVLFLFAGTGSAFLITRSAETRQRRSSPALALQQLTSELSNCRTASEVIRCFGRRIANLSKADATALDPNAGDSRVSGMPEEIQRVAAGWRTSLTIILGATSVLQMNAEIIDTPVGGALLKDIGDEAMHLSSLLGNAFPV
jgi:two-component system sensor histidine kinase KdpD